MRTAIIDVTVNGEKKPIEFYMVSAMEYHLGLTGNYIKELERKGMFPRTPYVWTKNGLGTKTNVRLFTKTQLDEVIELVENHYPVLYRGHDPIRKKLYQDASLDYSSRVRELEKKWKSEDYLAKEAPTYRPINRRKHEPSVSDS